MTHHVPLPTDPTPHSPLPTPDASSPGQAPSPNVPTPHSPLPSPLTARQDEILHWIAERTRIMGFPPTVREIAAAHGMSLNGAQVHITALIKKGRLRRNARQARSLVVIPLRGTSH